MSTTITPGETLSLGQAQVLYDAAARSYLWYIRDDEIAGDDEALTSVATADAPNGWAVAYDGGSQVFTVTAPGAAVRPGHSLHVGWRQGAAPSNDYSLSQPLGFPAPGPAVPTLTATPLLIGNVPAIRLAGY